MARTLWPTGVTGLEAATAALGSVVIESSHCDSGCDGGGFRARHRHSPDRHGVGPCAAVKVLVQPRCGCSLRLAGGRRFETEMPVSRREHYLMITTIEYQKCQ